MGQLPVPPLLFAATVVGPYGQVESMRSGVHRESRLFPAVALLVLPVILALFPAWLQIMPKGIPFLVGAALAIAILAAGGVEQRENDPPNNSVRSAGGETMLEQRLKDITEERASKSRFRVVRVGRRP
jgi:hypothetical protein